MGNVLIAASPAVLATFPLVGFGRADLRTVGIFVICLVLAISVHEFSHAFAAHKLGDSMPEGEGRLTLNPLAHYDLIGTIILPASLAIFYPGMLFGWGKPVNTNPRNYTRKVTMRGGMAIVAFAGPLSNLALAALTLLVIWGLTAAGVLGAMDTTHPLRTFFYLNILLFVFNLIPIHPLDGGKVLAWLLGPKYQHIDDFLTRYGGIILLVLIFALPGVLAVAIRPFYQLGDMALHAVL